MYSDPRGQTWTKHILEVRTGLRYFLSTMLLGVVWRHAHWSVALCLTLIFIMEEIRTYKGKIYANVSGAKTNVHIQDERKRSGI